MRRNYEVSVNIITPCGEGSTVTIDLSTRDMDRMDIQLFACMTVYEIFQNNDVYKDIEITAIFVKKRKTRP